MIDTAAAIKQCEEHMHKTVEHLEHELTKVRAGAANPMMLEGVRVDYYGQMVPLSQVAGINSGDSFAIVAHNLSPFSAVLPVWVTVGKDLCRPR